MLRVGRVRDCSVKPGASRGVAGRKGEDLQRKARAAGNAHIIKLIKKHTQQPITYDHVIINDNEAIEREHDHPV